ncbi:hypothetical protein JCM11251_002922 [Rhodosporidiobolus azoricus]
MAAQRSAPAQQLHTKKRRRTTDSQPATASTPSSAAPSPAPSPAPQPAPAAAPLSAVAARRAAREAAQAAAAQPSFSPAPPSTKPESAAPPSPPLDDTAADADGDSSSADEQETVPAGRPASAARVRKTVQGKSQGKGKGKGAAPPPSRYFAATADEDDEEEDVMLLDQGDEDEEEEDGELSPPEGLDADEQEALGPVNGSTADGEPTTPKSGRRRREKSAFVDPYCVSAFQVVEGVSAVRTEVIDPSTCVKRQAVVYALQEGESLVLHGAFLLAPLFGSVTSLGSTLTGSSPISPANATDEPTIYPVPSAPDAFHPFFAPSSHPLPPIFALPPSEGYSPRSLVLSCGEQLDLSRFAAAVVVLDHETGIERVERPLVLGGMGCASGMWPARCGSSSLDAGKTWKLITSPTPSLTSLRPIPHWDHAVSSALPPLRATTHDAGRFVALVEGPKRVGKSIMARMLTNALLDRYEAVAYLDTDLGQPEFTPPGFLSLHILRHPAFGPSFTHLAIPLSAQYLGSTSPVSDPASYISAAQALLETYALEVEYPLIDEPDRFSAFSRRRGGRFARMRGHEGAAEEEAARQVKKIRERVPLVVNTQGWVKGLGADLLVKLKEASRPTHVFSFAGSAEDGDAPSFDQFGDDDSQQLPYRLFSLPPAPPSPLESKWSAADYRILSLASYFHGVYPSASSVNHAGPTAALPSHWDFSNSLAASSPFPFSWSPDADPAQLHSVHLVAPGTADGEIKYEHILHALNGAVVALVTPPSGENSARPPRSFPYDPTSPAPSLLTGSRALGLALVHSVSPSTSTLHILTPLPPSLLAAHAPLSVVRGALELPTALMLDYSASVTDSERERGVCGVRWAGKDGKDGPEGVPFLVKGEEDGAVGAVGGRRRVRRNLMRRGQA